MLIDAYVYSVYAHVNESHTRWDNQLKSNAHTDLNPSANLKQILNNSTHEPKADKISSLIERGR